MDNRWDGLGETGAGLDAERELAESIRAKVRLLIAASRQPVSKLGGSVLLVLRPFPNGRSNVQTLALRMNVYWL